jgi:hypothetical protein
MVLIDAAKKTKMTVVKDWLVPGDVSPVHLSALEQHIQELDNGFWTGHGLVNGKWRGASTFGSQETVSAGQFQQKLLGH